MHPLMSAPPPPIPKQHLTPLMLVSLMVSVVLARAVEFVSEKIQSRDQILVMEYTDCYFLNEKPVSRVNWTINLEILNISYADARKITTIADNPTFSIASKGMIYSFWEWRTIIKKPALTSPPQNTHPLKTKPCRGINFSKDLYQ